MLKKINTIFIAVLLATGVGGCQKQTDTETTATTPPATSATEPTSDTLPATTPATAPASSSAPAEKHTSTSPAHSTSRQAPSVVVVPEQQQKSSNTAGEAAAMHRAVAAPLRRAIGAERYIQTHPPAPPQNP